MLQPSRLSLAIALCLVGLLFWSWRPRSQPLSGQNQPGWLLIQQAAVYDGIHPELSAPRDLLIHDGVIVSTDAAGLTLPAGTGILNAQGLTLMPNFTDLGIFPALQGGFAEDKVPGLSELNLRTKLASGVGSALALNSSVALMEEGQGLDRPLLRFAGPVLSSLEGWRPGPRADGESPVLEITDQEGFRRALDLLRSARAGILFLSMENAALEQPPFNEPELLLLGSLAKEAGLPLVVFAAHTNQALLAMKASPRLLVGPLAWEAVEPELIKAMKLARCAYAPALNSLLALWPWPNGLARLEALSEALILTPELRSSLSDPPRLSKYRSSLDESGPSKELALSNTLSLAQAGVPLGLASFSGAPGSPQGLGARSEIDFLLQAGLKLPEVMRLATSGSALIAGFDKQGQVKEGYHADLLLIKGDPLSDPIAHRRVRFVLRAGKPWIPRELRRL